MKKIITVFQRNHATDHLVRNEVTPGAEWVLSGEGQPTRKWDGTCVLYREGAWFKRYENRLGKVTPDGFIPADEIDSVTGRQPGWLKVGAGPEDHWHRVAIECDHLQNHEHPPNDLYPEGTYELVGPKINGNPEKLAAHMFIRHGTTVLSDLKIGRTFESIRAYLETHDVEGIVWHHEDGRMAKIKKKDFGWRR